MNRSPERNTFQLKNYLERCEADGKEPNEDYIELYRGEDRRDMEKEENAQWKLNNLEYDLRSNRWICDKAKANEAYAQNIYAALCNQDWQKNDVWPRLKGQTYSCSWRYAGGIVAHMRQEGDYIDWYCSGIRNVSTNEEDNTWWDSQHYVAESVVTEEIENDLYKLGWLVIKDNNE